MHEHCGADRATVRSGIEMQTAALIASVAVLVPAVGAVTAYNAWAVFISCTQRYRAQSDRMTVRETA